MEYFSNKGEKKCLTKCKDKPTTEMIFFRSRWQVRELCLTYVCLTTFPTPGIQFFILESQKFFYVEKKKKHMKCKILSFPKPATLVPIGHGMHTFFSLCNVTQMCLQYLKSGSSIQGLNASHLLNIISL